MIEIGVVNVADVGGEDDGHDDAVDGDDLTEDDGDQVLGPDARGPDAGAQDRRAGDEDAPVGLFDSARQLSVYKTIPYTRLCDRDGMGVVYLPCCPYDGETDTQADAQIRPYVW